MSPTSAARPLLRKVTRILLLLAALYVLILGAAFFFQRKLIYFPIRLEPPVRTAGPFGGEVVTFEAADGTGLHGLYVPPPTADAPVALVLHGNAGNLLTWAPFLEPYVRQGLGALLLDPRGYGWSEGEPSEEGWHQDAEAALAWLAARGSAAPRVVVVGVSIGSGPATALAARHPVRGLILQAAFTCLADAAGAHYPFLPCGLLLRDRYDNLAAAPRVRCPVLLFHGTADAVVPTDHAHRLAAAFAQRPVLHVVPGRGHDDVDGWSGYEGAVRAFVAGLR
jgi:pimeloyl-ACP methyl ester carboxylesterase